jgi:putative transposase
VQRKRPIHVTPVERHNIPIILFVTLAIQPRGSFLANALFRDAFVAACGDADAWSVGLYLIMPDHVHLFCRPAKNPAIGIKRWSVYLKERITKRLHVGNGKDGSVQVRPPEMHPPDGSPQVRPPKGTLWKMEGEAVPSRLSWRWQSDCWDTQIRNEEHYRNKWEYVRQNPARKFLVKESDEWPWQGCLNVIEW